LQQEPVLDPDKDVFGNISEGVAETKAVIERFEAVSARFAEELSDEEMNALIAEQGELQERIDQLDAWEIDRTIEIAMDALRCPPGDTPVATLSGGERRRVALCRLLLQRPDLLLLDEPTNHLDAESVAWLQRFLKDYPGTVVTVTHDRYFLDEVAGWILELDRGHGIPYEGNYSGWLEQKQARLAQEGRQEEARQRSLERELEWVRQSPRARQAKSKARLSAYEELVAQSREKAPDNAQIVLPPGPRLGDLVVEANGVSKAFGDRLLIESLDFRLPPGGIVGIIGPNGAGKTTLFRMITGAETTDAGGFRIGDTVRLGYVDQSRDTLNPNNTVWQEISGGAEEIDLGRRKLASRAYCSLFNFRGADQQKKVGQLSGGERNRVHLAKMLKEGANLLLLDEPTNDLDVDTLRALEEGLIDYPGCAVIITHDRWFLDRVATHILAFEGDSQTVWFEGNYADYEVDRRRRLGAAADQPHRIKYKPLTRS
jgi:sulfate-transporting ATPase